MTWCHGGAHALHSVITGVYFTVLMSGCLQSLLLTRWFSSNNPSPFQFEPWICCSLRNRINTVVRVAWKMGIREACGTNQQHGGWALVNKTEQGSVWPQRFWEVGLWAPSIWQFSRRLKEFMRSPTLTLSWSAWGHCASELITKASIYWGFLMVPTIFYTYYLICPSPQPCELETPIILLLQVRIWKHSGWVTCPKFTQLWVVEKGFRAIQLG